MGPVHIATWDNAIIKTTAVNSATGNASANIRLPSENARPPKPILTMARIEGDFNAIRIMRQMTFDTIDGNALRSLVPIADGGDLLGKMLVFLAIKNIADAKKS
jgi:hypothetical protein